MNKFLNKLVFWKDCREYGMSIWQCPNFLFLVIGIITITTMLGSYVLGQVYMAPEYVIPIVIASTLLIFVPGAVMVRSFEKMAESNIVKSEFVSIASHQLRSPLSAIKWSLEIVLSGRVGELSKEHKEYLEVIKDSNDVMLDLVNDLLSISRIEKNEFKLQEKTIDLAKVVDKVCVSFKTCASESCVKVSKKLPSKPVYVRGDDTYVEMVISNLIDNAIRYSKENGKVKVKLNTQKGFAHFEVEDEGVGIPKKEQKYIFTKFFRSSNAKKHQTGGTGLGLYIAKEVVTQLDGRIGFSSTENKGTVFWFEIPLKNKKFLKLKNN